MRRLLPILLALALASSLVAQTAGTLRVSGRNDAGQLGNGETAYSADLTEIASGVTDVYVGLYHMLYKDRSDDLWGIGVNVNAQLGNHPLDLHHDPVLVAREILHATAGYYSTFYWKQNGSLYALGNQTYNLWGDNLPAQRSRPDKLFHGVKKVVSNWTVALYLFDDGRVYGRGWPFLGWDPNVANPMYEYAKLADGVFDIAMLSFDPVLLREDGTLVVKSDFAEDTIATKVSAVEGNGSFIMFRNDLGELFVYGDSEKPALGIGGGSAELSPRLVATRVRSFHVGQSSKCAFFIKDSGELWGMGANDRGQLGLGDFTVRDTPTLITTNVKAVGNNSDGTAVVLEDGRLLVAGDSRLGMFGTQPQSAKTPTIVASNVLDVELGRFQLFFIDDKHALWSSGRNDLGQLGLGHYRHVATTERAAEDVAAVRAGADHVLYLTRGGDIYGAGSNSHGQLGDIGEGTADFVFIASNIAHIEAGDESTYYITKSGELYGLGRVKDFKRTSSLDESTETPQLIATDVADAGATSVLYYLTKDGELWGAGDSLLTRFYGDESSERRVLLETDVTTFAGNWRNVAYVKDDGTLWHLTHRGKEIDKDSEPELIDADVVEIEGEAGTTLYQKTDGSLWCSLNGSSFEQFSAEAAEAKGGDFQIHAASEIYDFAIGGGNVAYVTGPVPAPVVTHLSADRASVDAGEPVTLTVESSGAFESYQWYEGELGDRSKPIEHSNLRELIVYRLSDSSFWVEAKNETGSGSSDSALEMLIGNPDFGAWATRSGLSGWEGHSAKDPDRDGAPNLEEYALGTNPLSIDQPVFDVEFLPELGLLSFTYAFDPEAKVKRSYRWGRARDVSGRQFVRWQDLSSDELSVISPDAQLVESEGQINLTVPLDGAGLPFLFRLAFESAE